jgi:2-C-methyl-D-erythritol 4-phosphate cytidylyltransferase
MSAAAIIVAAGSSQRMGFDKLAADLCGRPVLAHAVAAFCDAPSVTEIIVVCPEDRFRTLLGGPFSKPLRRVEGGSSRQESVRNGLLSLSENIAIVAVHDGARPLVTPDAIEACLEMARRNGACSLARRVTETLKRASTEGLSQESVERDHLWFMETPQCFSKELLLRAYEHVSEKRLTVTDEVSALEAIGIATHLMESRSANLKITVPADLALAAYWMDAAAQTR